ncbi:MAG: nucleotidyltransferase domain-containing protein [Candidatus Binatia bacterium]
MVNVDKQLARLLNKAQDDSDILAVLLFGSAARGEQTAASDVDVCLFLQLRTYAPLTLSQKKLAYRQGNDLDVQVFQQLPLYIRHRVLKEGKVLFARDLDMLYAVAFRTAQEFEDFKPIYRAYLAEVARAGS